MKNQEKLILLLIVDEDFHKAEQITSSLRATGMQVRAEFAEDGEDMDEMLANKNFDLVLFSLDLPEVSIAEAQQLIVASGKHVGLIALAQKVDASVMVEAINQGARDVLVRSNTKHLIQVVKREAGSIQLWRRAHRLELSFQESERRCQSLLSSSRDAVAYVHEGMHIYANQAYMELFGNTNFDELEGTPIIDMVDASQQNQVKAFLRDLDEQRNEPGQLELKLIRSNGENLSATVEFSPASYDGEPCNQVLIRSADEKAELEEKINYLHQHDLVSGLYNRQYFMRALKGAMGRAVKGDSQYAIVYFAIDNFQSIRDTVGISGCDVLISDVAIILTENADADYALARFGACSYASLCILKEKQLVEQYAAKILERVEQHISEIGKQSISVTCSAAIVFIDENSPDNPNSLVSRAEKTCEEVQRQGGNISKTYILKAGEMTQDEEDGITADLIKDALKQNRIKALYQPIVGIKGQDGERYQSSIQITVEDGRILGEAEYQSAAERTGTAKMLDRWKVLRAIKKISDSSKRGRAIEFLIPLSADSIKDSGLALWVSENLGKAKINGQQLVFMVNEAQVLSQLKAAKNLSKSLKQFKCQLAIDEFGAGLNPFQLVKHIEADYVRISHLFMNGLSQDSKNQECIREFTRRAGEMKLKTITPGVTDASILSVLWTLDVDFIQGDFLQAPQAELNYDFRSV
ncbi:MAG TPA: EAL domain-containing protein [Gammaproteobacteria bacterium]|nr:EAL domain-containing protein [Gammaproteobacteria bacterium]